jgi:cell division protein FtsA
MSGVRLEAKVHIVTGADSAAQVSSSACSAAARRRRHRPRTTGLEHAVLTEDEKDLGVCVVDIGGGTADIAVSAAARSATRR